MGTTSRVDWSAVDRMLGGQAGRVAGFAMNSAGNTYYWYENDTRMVGTGNPGAHYVSGPGSPAAVDFPSSRIGVDIVGSAISTSDQTYTCYSDGKVRVGTANVVDDQASHHPRRISHEPRAIDEGEAILARDRQIGFVQERRGAEAGDRPLAM